MAVTIKKSEKDTVLRVLNKLIKAIDEANEQSIAKLADYVGSDSSTVVLRSSSGRHTMTKGEMIDLIGSRSKEKEMYNCLIKELTEYAFEEEDGGITVL